MFNLGLDGTHPERQAERCDDHVADAQVQDEDVCDVTFIHEK